EVGSRQAAAVVVRQGKRQEGREIRTSNHRNLAGFLRPSLRFPGDSLDKGAKPGLRAPLDELPRRYPGTVQQIGREVNAALRRVEWHGTQQPGQRPGRSR